MSNHTPGPWTDCDDFGEGAIVALRQGEEETPVICTMALETTESDANARLIAAAPELLEEVRNIRAWLEYWKGRTISQQSKDERGNVTNTWAACPIPDWDVKQKLESLETIISKAEGAAEALEAERPK